MSRSEDRPQLLDLDGQRASPTRLSRRTALKAGVAGGAALVIPNFGASSASAASAQGGSASWKRYPYELYPANGLVLPAAEGVLPSQSDTWYIDAKLETPSGRAYAFVVIYVKTRIGAVRADFYTFSVYDLQTGEYGTFTEYDYPDKSLFGSPRFHGEEGYLDLRFATKAGVARWTTRRDASGTLIPFAYRLDLVGRDSGGRLMRLQADMDPGKAPEAVGGPTTQGNIECFGAKDTYTYFQTDPNVSGTLSWGDETHSVVGRRGHIDRQIFNKYVGAKAGLFGRDRSHEWRSINLDDGTDISAWRQFDRTKRNKLTAFTGATRVFDGQPSESTSKVDVEYIDYVKWPTSIPTSYNPPSKNRWSPSEHIVRVPEWDLELHARPLCPVPAHKLPVEYMIGPVQYTGTFAGRPVSGFGVSERTLSMWRDWELAQVFSDTVAHLPASVYRQDGVTQTQLAAQSRRLRRLVDQGPLARGQVAQYLSTTVEPAVATLQGARRPMLAEVLKDLRRAPIG